MTDQDIKGDNMKRVKLIRAIIIFILISAFVVLKLFTTVLGKPVFIYIDALDPERDHLSFGYSFHKVDDVEGIHAYKQDLDKIKYCKNLKVFRYSHELEDLDFFDNPDLEELYIRGCSDISGLEKLSDLKVFSFWNADVSDLSYISSLRALNELELRTSNNLDCENIDQLCELERLEIFGASLSEYQLIADLPKLSYLSIQVDNYENFDLSFIKRSDSIKKVTLWEVPADKQRSIKEEFENSGIESKFE